mgnify:CR=1 FL=1
MDYLQIQAKEQKEKLSACLDYIRSFKAFLKTVAKSHEALIKQYLKSLVKFKQPYDKRCFSMDSKSRLYIQTYVNLNQKIAESAKAGHSRLKSLAEDIKSYIASTEAIPKKISSIKKAYEKSINCKEFTQLKKTDGRDSPNEILQKKSSSCDFETSQQMLDWLTKAAESAQNQTYEVSKMVYFNYISTLSNSFIKGTASRNSSFASSDKENSSPSECFRELSPIQKHPQMLTEPKPPRPPRSHSTVYSDCTLLSDKSFSVPKQTFTSKINRKKSLS